MAVETTLRLSHVRLLVKDFTACFRFYRDVLGFEVLWGEAEKPSEAEAQDRAALIFAVEDVDATYESLKMKGVTFVTEPMDRPDWGIRAAHFRDPDGNLLEIYRDLGA